MAQRPLLAAGSLPRNTIAALIQALLVSLCLFLVYRIVVREVGLEGLGIWSLLMIGSTVARVGDLSGGAALARFIAPRDTLRDGEALADIVHTVTLTSLGIMVLLCAALLAALPLALPRVLPPSGVALAWPLVPLVLAIIIVGAVATVITSGLDGVQRADQRAMLMSTSAIAMLGLAAWLVPSLGLAGFAWAQLISQLLVVGFGWAMLRRHIPVIGWFPGRWRRWAFAETFSFGLKLNGVMVLTLLLEPMVKLAINEAGDAARVALYELASRVVTQVRSLVVAAAMPLMPAIARFSAVQRVERDALMLRAMQMTSAAAVLAAAASLALAPIASWLVLGRVSSELLLMAIALAFGWAAHLPSLAFYLAAQADGRLRWNALSHLVIGLVIIAALGLFAPVHGEAAIIAAVVVGLLASLVTLLFGNAALLGLWPVLRRAAPLLTLAIMSALALSVLAAFLIT